MTNTKEYKFIDLFAGIGGFRLALESYNLKCVFSSEWDKHAQLTYIANFHDVPAGDITKIRAKDIPHHNILCGGFPCQPFSISGKQLGFNDSRGNLFFDIARISEHHKPEVLFLENVKNFEKHDNGNTLKTVKKILEDIGYNIFYKVLNSSFFGTPTVRERIYIIGFRNDLKISKYNFPEPTYKSVKLADFLENNVETNKYQILRNDIKIYPKNIQPDMYGGYPLKPVRIGTINKGGQGERIYSPYGHTITLSAYGGGVASKTGAYLINDKIRKLSPRECARVMGFPDTFKIPVNDSQAYKQFGNSVVVSVIKILAESIINTLETKIK